jgi:hypothetical protein
MINTINQDSREAIHHLHLAVGSLKDKPHLNFGAVATDTNESQIHLVLRQHQSKLYITLYHLPSTPLAPESLC